MKKKILVFSGAGVSKESGIETFRDSSESLWNNHKIEDVATISAWRKNKELVLNFYNERRRQLKEVEPNEAHKMIALLEKYYDVIVVTQNVDDLHERAGSTKILHLHGCLNKVSSTLDPSYVYDWFDDVNIGDKCELGSQLRPYIVWFGEKLNDSIVSKSIDAAKECDICIIIGTSLQVSPANEIPFLVRDEVPIYYIDPNDFSLISDRVIHIKDVASVGMKDIHNELVNESYESK